MFTFSHITSIGLSSEEYTKRLAAGEKNLVKGENKWYREVATEVTVPVTLEELQTLVPSSNEKIKLGEKSFDVPDVVKHYIVGLKLAVNQKVQAAERDGGVEWKSILTKIISSTPQTDPLFAKALMALTGKAASGKAFAEKWMEENPKFMG